LFVSYCQHRQGKRKERIVSSAFFIGRRLHIKKEYNQPPLVNSNIGMCVAYPGKSKSRTKLGKKMVKKRM
jgi:hypothetical protein